LPDPKPSPAADPAVQDLVRRKARKLSRQAGFHRQDEQDLAQELFVRLLARLARLQPGREHLVGFITNLIEQVAANLVRHTYAAKRDRRSARLSPRGMIRR
jgi:DNA-directed RNA polymerase specialized sigma24 family protein